MARKSRLTLWQERLAEISSSPPEIFDKIEPTEETYNTIQMAEGGDLGAIRQINSELYGAYIGAKAMNPALSYFIKLGLDRGDCEAARLALCCFANFDEAIDLFPAAMSILATDEDKPLRDAMTVKEIIVRAEKDKDYVCAIERLAPLDTLGAAYARVFIGHKIALSLGERDGAVAAAKAMGIESVMHLPVFDADGTESASGDCEGLRIVASALTEIKNDGWRDFWLKATYEYADKYLGGDLSAVIENISAAVEQRCDYPRKKLHLLALKKYLLDSTQDADDEDYNLLADKCRFDGHSFNFDDTDERDRIIKEAIYTSSREEREANMTAERLGTVIDHVKNRYSFKAGLSNHTKRAFRHIWSITLSIESDTDQPPKFGTMNIDERRYVAQRCGAELEQKRKLSQIICSGEITVNDRICPIEADLLLDIAYVSTTKCGHCDVRIQKAEKLDNYLVMKCLLIIY